MNAASSTVDRPEAPLFADGLGERVVSADATTGELLQFLRVRPALTAVPSFEFALRERTARLANFRHAYYARVRRIDRVQANGSTLAIVSDHVEGVRLSEILRIAHQRGLQLDTNAALCLVRQLVPAVALLHENARDASHGLIAPERLIVTPHARLVIVEHVAGSAIEQLQYSRERLWQELRIAMPPAAGIARFDHRADVNGIGITALSLILGRLLGPNEFPHALSSLLLQAQERTALGDERPLSPALRNWLGRTLQLDVRRAFASAPEALAALEDVLANDTSYVPAPVALEAFLSQYINAVLEPASPAAPSQQAAPSPARRVAAPVDIYRAEPHRERAIARPPEPSADPLASVPSLDELIDTSDLTRPADAAPRTPVQEVPAPLQPAPVSPLEDAYLSLDGSGPETDEPAAAAGDVKEFPFEDGERTPARSRTVVFALVAALVLLVGGAYVWRTRFAAPGASLGTLVVQSRPAGVEVFVDGVSRGMTPAQISLPAGSHILELRGRGVPRVIPLQVPAGGQVSQYLEFADTPNTGMLVVHSQPAGAKVTVDGVARATTPLTLEGLEPGDHEVILQDEAGSSRHIVKVLAGTTASLVAPVRAQPASEGPVSGWVSIKAPFTIDIREDGKLLGTTETERVMLAAGRHVLELVNEPLGYREVRTVQVAPGKVAEIALELPNGKVNLNATPWAEVWIDGQRVGETPIGNLDVPIGAHEVVFRHPQFGEKRHAISVTTIAPVRLSVAMN